MLHNSELYSPSEVPGSMGAPINKAVVGGPMDIAPILCNKRNLDHNQPTPSIPQYTPQHYPAMGLETLPIEAQINPFLSHSSFRSNSDIYPSIPGMYGQNGLSPFDFNATNTCPPEYNHAFHQKVFYGQMSSTKTSNWLPTNTIVPQIQNEPAKKVHNNPNDVAKYVDDNPVLRNKCTANPKDNYDLEPIKSKDLIHLRTERIENTFRHIESIIATDISSRKKALECTNKEKKGKQTEEKQKDPILYENSSSESESDSDDEDSVPAKPQEIEIKVEPNEEEKDNGEVVVKLEKISWTETDFRNPFIHDQNGVTKDNVDSLEEIVEAHRSVEEAKHAVEYGLSDDTRHYECRHCGLHFCHPKRFLIHHSWHTFGLTNLSRQIQALAKEARKLQRSGELFPSLPALPSVAPAAPAEAGAGATGAGEGEAAFPCRECEKVFKKKGALKRHKTKAHKKPVTECRMCNAAVSDWRALREHHATHHQGRGSFQCDRCDKVFKHKHNLTKHAQSHFEKTHPCPHCPKMFTTEQLARNHARIHTEPRVGKEAKHHCSYCARSFTENFNLQAHERLHRNERPFQCTICSSAYGTNSSLKRHIRVSHNSDKPFKCPTCHKGFGKKNVLDRHCLMTHTDPSEFKYPCSICTGRYLTQRDLRRHVYKAHTKKLKMKLLAAAENE